MLYNLRHALAVNVDRVSPGPVEVGDFLFWLVHLLWPCSLIATSDGVKWDSPIAKKSVQVPSTRKLANISPVRKDDKRELVINYRSISLLSIPCKCQERLAHDVIYEHVHPYLPEWQHGFMKGRSCATQTIAHRHNWEKTLDHVHQVNGVFLDFSKAFDRVSHHILLSIETPQFWNIWLPTEVV